MNVLLTGSLVLLLVAALLKRQATQGKRPEVALEVGTRTVTKKSRSLTRIGRRPQTEIPGPPRKRRNRPKLGLSVAGLPAAESVAQATLDQPDAPSPADDDCVDTPVGNPHAGTERFADTALGGQSSADHCPIELDLASLVDSVARVPHVIPVPLAMTATQADRAAGAPLSAGGTAVFIDAPGWPHPGEIGFALDSFEPQPGNATAPGTTLTDDSTYVPDGAASAADRVDGVDQDDPFDPARGWTDSALAGGDAPDAAPAEWTVNGAVEAAGAVCADESPSWDAHAWNESSADATVAEAWGEPDWSWDHDATDGVAATVDASQRATPLDDPARGETSPDWTDPVVEGTPTVDEPLDRLTADEAPAEGTSDLIGHAPVITMRGTHTTRLEKRLATAEDELRRIAKRTKSKKGDLRNAAKKKIAKQVRKALSDPEMAHHFAVRVGKGRLAFERRTEGLPVVTVAGASVTPMAGTTNGADLLAALQGPLRASLLSGLLADYANAEAERRVAEILRQHAGPRNAPDDFDALVARLAHISQGPLLGIDAPARTSR